MKLLRTEYKVANDKPVIYLFLREDGKRRVVTDNNFEPYFYIPVDEVDKAQGLKVNFTAKHDIYGNEVLKVFTKLPEDVPNLRDNFTKTWEADIIFPIRYQIDCIDNLEPTEAKIMILDIEVDNPGERMPDSTKDPTICVSSYNNFLECYDTFVWSKGVTPGAMSKLFDGCLHEVRYFRSEAEMLEAFVEFLTAEEPDIITGWNIVRFDLPYLFSRLSELGISYNSVSPIGSAYKRDDGEVVIKGVAIVDLYDAYRKVTFNEEESYKLDYIAKKVTGEGKTWTGSVRWLWNNDLDKLVEYNTMDVRLCKAIDSKLQIIPFLDELRRLCFCHLEDTISASKSLDCFTLRMQHGKRVLPTKQHHKKESYQGAFVERWGSGVYNSVVMLDLKSLYPAIIYSSNMSPETVVGEGEIIDDVIEVDKLKFRRTPQGFLPKVVEHLFGERQKYKGLMKGVMIGTPEWRLYNSRQYAIKILTNALYGQLAYSGSRIYNPSIAAAVTHMGREIITWSKQVLEGMGAHKVLMVDTDSLAITRLDGGTISESDIVEIQTKINASYSQFVERYGMSEHIFSLELDKIYRKAFFGMVKKRYAGHVIFQDGQKADYLQVVGFEAKRSDNSHISHDIQNDIFEMLLLNDKSKEEILDHISGKIQEIWEGKYDLEDLGIPKGISRGLDTYVVEPANIRGAKYARDVLKLQLSSKPKLVYVKKMPGGYPATDVLCYDEPSQIPPGVEVDMDKMLDKTIRVKIESIFEALGWDMRELRRDWNKTADRPSQLSLF